MAIPVLAVRFDGGFKNYNEISKWIQSQKPADEPDYFSMSIWYGGFGDAGRFIMSLPYGEVEVPPGHYIIRSSSNKYAVVDKETFDKIYQRQYNFVGDKVQ